MSDAYSGYTYHRYKKKKRFFAIVVLTVGVCVLALGANLIFGFVDFSHGFKKNDTVTIPEKQFYITYGQVFQNKSDAIANAVGVKETGGAGYLLNNPSGHRQSTYGNDLSSANAAGGWVVVGEIYDNNSAANAAAVPLKSGNIQIKLTDETHKDIVTRLCMTFNTTFDTLIDFIARFDANTMTRAEITNHARIAYNNLIDLIGEFETVTPFGGEYTNLSKYVAKELFALGLLWLDANTNFAHTLKNAACWVAFATV